MFSFPFFVGGGGWGVPGWMMSSSSNSPCAACKFLRRKCTQGCVFAPYFPPDQPNKFACVHRVFGASNVAKLLNDISPAQREDAVNSLAYEADARLKDPVYGCVAYISLLELRLRQLRVDLHNAKKELAAYIGPAAFGPFLPSAPQQFHHPQFQSAASPMMGLGLAAAAAAPQQLMIRDHPQSQSQMVVDAQPMVVASDAAAQREQEMFRTYDHQQQQQEELARLSSVYDARGVYNHGAQQLGGGGPTVAIAGSAGGLSLLPPQAYDGAFTTTNQHQQQPQQLMLEHHQRAGSDEGRSGIGPSS